MRNTTAGAIIVSAVIALCIYGCLEKKAFAGGGHVETESAYPPAGIGKCGRKLGVLK